MLKKIFNFFKSPKLQNIDASVSSYNMSYVHDGLDGTHHRPNMETLTRENLKMHHDALQRNLIIMHRTMLISFIAVIAAVVSIVVAIAFGNQERTIKIELNGQEAVQKID